MIVAAAVLPRTNRKNGPKSRVDEKRRGLERALTASHDEAAGTGESLQLCELARMGVALRRQDAPNPRQRAGRLGLALCEERRLPRGGALWSAADDDLLRLHAGLNPAVLGQLLGRSDRAVTIRLSKLGLRAGRERSPHHAVPRLGDLTPGERALLARELQPGNPRRLRAVAGRLGLPSNALAARLPGRRDSTGARAQPSGQR